MGPNRTVSGAQFTLLFLASYLTAGLFSFPREIVRIAGGGAIWSLLLTSALALAMALLITWIGSHFPGKTAVQWGDLLITAPINRVLVTLGAGFHLVVQPLIIRAFAEMLKGSFFQQTPVWALTLALMMVAWYGTLLGVEVLGRAATVVLPTLLLAVTGSYGLAYPLMSAYRLRPLVGEWSAILQACFFASMLYEGIASVMVLQSKLPQPARAMRYVCYSIAVGTVIFTLIYLSTLAVFGRWGVDLLVFPAPQLVMTIRLRGWFLERLGLFVEIIWTGLVLLNTAVHQWAISLAAAQIMGLHHRKAYPWNVAVVGVVQFMLALAPRSIDDVFYFMHLAPWGGLYLNAALPLLWAVVGLARGKLRPGRTAACSAAPEG